MTGWRTSWALARSIAGPMEVWEIAGLPWVQVLDFGQMDFVSPHNGAIPASAMRSSGQFEHRLLVRAKAELVAAASATASFPRTMSASCANGQNG